MECLQYPFDGAYILQKKRALRKELLQKPGLLEKKIAIVSGTTLGDIPKILELFLLEAGIRPVFYEGEYGLFYEDVVFDNGALRDFAPDVLYIHTSNRNLRGWPDVRDDSGQAADKLQQEYTRFETVWQAAEKLGCPVIQNNFEMPAFRNLGNLDAWDSRGRVAFVRHLNQRLEEYAAAHSNFYIHDLEWLSAMHGVDTWCDDAAWYGYKYSLAPACIPHLAHSLANLIKSLFGLVKKALVSDLDNTLWGGVIGEVGPEGVELGSETPAGMAYSALQEYMGMLSHRGILLTVASKNEPEIAASGFGRGDSPLQKEDFLCFEAGWHPKSQSIQRIAETLNIGIDSLVFVDDNPAEREEVTQVWPQVQAPAVTNPENSVRLLDRGGYFEVSALSGDDSARTEMYRQNAQRAQQEQSFADYDAYLRSLAMWAEIGPFRADQMERVTQLINKTNQFNLTTRRYTQAEVESCAAGEDYITLSGKLYDKFGDNGITSALIAHRSGDVLDIQLWVMSCRVFKRQLELAMFDALVKAAQALGVRQITGRFIPTAKNLLVRDFYATIGFVAEQEQEGAVSFRYTLPAQYQNQNTVIEVRTDG